MKAAQRKTKEKRVRKALTEKQKADASEKRKIKASADKESGKKHVRVLTEKQKAVVSEKRKEKASADKESGKKRVRQPRTAAKIETRKETTMKNKETEQRKILIARRKVIRHA